jgi:hypothetical protein
MEYNIIDIINRNEFFLKKLFPDGLIDVKIGRVNLFFEDKLELEIYTRQKPSFSPSKWGEWGVNYTTIVIQLSGHFLKKIHINNWQNNKLTKCHIEISKKNDVFNIHIKGDDWDVWLELECLIYQNSSVYFDENFIEDM